MFTKTFTTGIAALAIAASTSLAMAQATGTGNNATSGSSTGSDTRMKGSDMKDSGGMSDSKTMKSDDTPTSAGTKGEQAKDLRGHSETPTTGK